MSNNGVANIMYNMAIDEPGNLKTDPYRMLGGRGGVSLVSMNGN